MFETLKMANYHERSSKNRSRVARSISTIVGRSPQEVPVSGGRVNSAASAAGGPVSRARAGGASVRRTPLRGSGVHSQMMEPPLGCSFRLDLYSSLNFKGVAREGCSRINFEIVK